ncbi:MAG: hypothetical protein ACE5JG_13430 [Planctomycetota bacterium]
MDVTQPAAGSGLPDLIDEDPDGNLGAETAPGSGLWVGTQAPDPSDPTASRTRSATVEIPLTSDALGTPTTPTVLTNESRFVVPPSPLPEGLRTLGRQFVRLRIVFDASQLMFDSDGDGTPEPFGTPQGLLGLPPAAATDGGIYAFPGAGTSQIAPGNISGNLDTAPLGVPAVAEAKVEFTPGNPFAIP